MKFKENLARDRFFVNIKIFMPKLFPPYVF